MGGVAPISYRSLPIAPSPRPVVSVGRTLASAGSGWRCRPAQRSGRSGTSGGAGDEPAAGSDAEPQAESEAGSEAEGPVWNPPPVKPPGESRPPRRPPPTVRRGRNDAFRSSTLNAPELSPVVAYR